MQSSSSYATSAATAPPSIFSSNAVGVRFASAFFNVIGLQSLEYVMTCQELEVSQKFDRVILTFKVSLLQVFDAFQAFDVFPIVVVSI